MWLRFDVDKLQPSSLQRWRAFFIRLSIRVINIDERSDVSGLFMLVCTKHKVLLFHEDELMKYKCNTSSNTRKTENTTLAFNFYRPVNSQAITHPPPLQSKTEQQLGDEPPQAQRRRGSLNSSRTASRPSLQSDGFFRGWFNFIRRINVYRGITRWQFHHGHVQFVTSVVSWSHDVAVTLSTQLDIVDKDIRTFPDELCQQIWMFSVKSWNISKQFLDLSYFIKEIWKTCGNKSQYLWTQVQIFPNAAKGFMCPT